ncbi:MAG: hypothetical protein JWM29_991 [Solirubrobacterales bacterium]|nr:hypothetical protein [Solirubrobacterales bacterium]
MIALAALVALPASTLAASAPTSGSTRASLRHALLTSRELWATVDVCNPPDQRYWVGVRGSMPGDGHPRDKMYMSFRLQYMDTSKQWVDASSAKSPFVAVGTGASARQGGNSFKFVRGVSPFTLRGVVDFQWRRGTTVLWSAARTTTAGHHNASDADPAGFSAASCSIG